MPGICDCIAKENFPLLELLYILIDKFIDKEFIQTKESAESFKLPNAIMCTSQ